MKKLFIYETYYCLILGGTILESTALVLLAPVINF